MTRSISTIHRVARNEIHTNTGQFDILKQSKNFKKESWFDCPCIKVGNWHDQIWPAAGIAIIKQWHWYVHSLCSYIHSHQQRDLSLLGYLFPTFCHFRLTGTGADIGHLCMGSYQGSICSTTVAAVAKKPVVEADHIPFGYTVVITWCTIPM